MRRVLTILLLPCLCLLGACGDDPVRDGVLVNLMTSEGDGPFEGTPLIKALEGEAGRVYRLEPTDEAGVWRAPGAKPGDYRVYTDAGWGMLWTGRTGGAAPRLQGAEFPPTLVRIGAPRSLYVACADPSLPAAPVTMSWAAEVKPMAAGDAVPFRAVDLEIADQGEGIVSLRFSAEDWKAGMAIRAMGRMADGSVSETLEYAVRDLEHIELPRMALVWPAPQAPLAVSLVPATGTAAVAEGTRLWVRVRGIPLATTVEARTYQGVARFDTLPTVVDGVEVFLQEPREGDVGFSIDLPTWRRRLAMHLAVPPDADAAVPVPFAGVAADAGLEVRVRYPGRDRFARVAPEAAEGGAVVALVEGTQDVLLGRADGTWRHDVVVVQDGQVTRHVRGTFEQACVVRGTARGTGGGGAVVFTRLLDAVEGVEARRAAGQGFQAHIPPDHTYELSLPPGRYEIQLWAPQGPRGRPMTQTMRPGAKMRLQLSTR